MAGEGDTGRTCAQEVLGRLGDSTPSIWREGRPVELEEDQVPPRLDPTGDGGISRASAPCA